jgi:hypothetical protein
MSFSLGQWTDRDLTQETGTFKADYTPFGYFVKADELCGLVRNRTAKSYLDQIVVYFGYGWVGWSNATDEFVVMSSVWNPKDLAFFAHEVGHYFHLPHTFTGITDINTLTLQIQDYVEGMARDKNNGQLPQAISADLLDKGLVL